MDAVFGPGLGQGLQFGIGGVAPLLEEVAGDGPEFIIIKAELLPFLA